jgi:hypothetical protein
MFDPKDNPLNGIKVAGQESYECDQCEKGVSGDHGPYETPDGYVCQDCYEGSVEEAYELSKETI